MCLRCSDEPTQENLFASCEETLCMHSNYETSFVSMFWIQNGNPQSQGRSMADECAAGNFYNGRPHLFTALSIQRPRLGIKVVDKILAVGILEMGFLAKASFLDILLDRSNRQDLILAAKKTRYIPKVRHQVGHEIVNAPRHECKRRPSRRGYCLQLFVSPVILRLDRTHFRRANEDVDHGLFERIQCSQLAIHNFHEFFVNVLW
jgi:hypothetical protein